MVDQNAWAPWVMKIRGKLSPYSRILLGTALVLTVIIYGASVHTEFWEPISDHPRKLRAIALLIMCVAVIFVPPPNQRKERTDRSNSQRIDK